MRRARVQTLATGDRFMVWGRFFEIREQTCVAFGRRWRLAVAVRADGTIGGESVVFADEEHVAVELHAQVAA